MKWFDYGHKVSSIRSLKINLSGDSKATLKSPCAKGYYLTQKLEPASVRLSVIVYLAIITLAISFFFHNLTFWRYEGFKNLIPNRKSRFKFFYQSICLGTVVAKILTTVPNATYSSFTNGFKFSYTLVNVLMFRHMVIYKH